MANEPIENVGSGTSQGSDIQPANDMQAFLAQRRKKNVAIVLTVFGLAVLFFLITILRMDMGG